MSAVPRWHRPTADQLAIAEIRDQKRVMSEPWPFAWTAPGHDAETWAKITAERHRTYLMRQGMRGEQLDAALASWSKTMEVWR